MATGKPGGGVRTKAATKPSSKTGSKSNPKSKRARTPAPRRQRPSAEDAGAGKRAKRTVGKPAKRSDAAVLAAEVDRLERQLSAARQELAAVEARADIDPLTELPNRRAFERELARSLAYVKRHGTTIALLYLDLDDFKRVNDLHGHVAGDAMLRAVASVLARQVRESDVVARIGGDEFALLLWNCDEHNARTKALVLEASVGRTTAVHEGVTLGAGASVGAAMLLPLDEPAETIARADRAMYARKAARRAA